MNPLTDGFGEYFWAKNLRVFAPAQNPSLDFFQRPQRHLQLDFSSAPFPDLLAGVPVPFSHQTGGKRVETDFDEMLARLWRVS